MARKTYYMGYGGKKRFWKIKHSFLENLEAEGVSKDDLNSLEEYFHLQNSLINVFARNQSGLFYLALINISFVLSTKDSVMAGGFVLIVTIIFISTILNITGNTKDNTKIRNIYHFLLCENLNNKLKDIEDSKEQTLNHCKRENQ